MSEAARVEVRREGDLLRVVLNDPDRANALSPAMVAELTEIFRRDWRADGVRALLLSGAGRHFCAGADLAHLAALQEATIEENRRDSQALRDLFAALLRQEALTVALVHGSCVAGGCGLATACDLVVAEPAARFAYTEVKIGFLAAMVLTFLTRRVPGHVARRLLLDPEMIDGERAVSIGLADELANPGSAIETAIERARTVCAKASPAALAATKALLNEVVGLGWRDALAAAAEANVRQRRHPDCVRGVRSFLEDKTTPDWLEAADDGE